MPIVPMGETKKGTMEGLPRRDDFVDTLATLRNTLGRKFTLDHESMFPWRERPAFALLVT